MKNLLFFICLLSILPSYGIWREIPTSTNENLNKIEIINGVSFCVGENGTILKSNDEGETWTSITTTATGNIVAIKFINNTIGFFTTSDGFVFKTTNGGDDWTGTDIHTGGVNGVDFANDNIGIAVADNGVIFRTTNGGSSWTSLGSISVYTITGITFLTESLAVAVGTQGSYLVSEDGGATWVYKSIPTTVAFSKIEKTSSTSAVAVGSGGYVSDFSATTLTLSNATKVDEEDDWIKDVFVIKPGETPKSILVGFSSSIYVMHEGWKTWDLDSINNLNGVHFYNDTIGIACGFNGKIYKTTSGGVPSSVNYLKKEKTQIYPNPTNGNVFFDETVIYADLMIYNIEGKLVYQQYVQSNQLDLGFLKNGLYFLRFLKGEKIFTGRIIKE